LAAKQKLAEHKILEKNKLSGYSDIEPGQILKIPNDYAPEMLIYLNKKTLLPESIKVFDEEGLYEEYTYLAVDVNPTFAEDEFSKSFDSYGF